MAHAVNISHAVIPVSHCKGGEEKGRERRLTMKSNNTMILPGYGNRNKVTAIMLREDGEGEQGREGAGSGRQSAMTNGTNANSSDKINTKHKTNIWSKVVTSAQAELKAYLEKA